jgi:hypothetical protein
MASGVFKDGHIFVVGLLYTSGSIVARKMKKKKVMPTIFFARRLQHGHVKDECDDRR